MCSQWRWCNIIKPTNERTKIVWDHMQNSIQSSSFSSSSIMDLRTIGLFFLSCLSWHNLLLLQWQAIKKRRTKQRRWWVRPVNRLWNAQGFYHNLIQELIQSDHEEFFELYRMWPEQFNLLVNLVHPHIKKNSIWTPFPTELRLAVTLL